MLKNQYIIQYPEGEKLGVSYGVLKEIYKNKEYNFKHLCCTKEGSSGSPIINLNNNKVFGIHRGAGNIGDYNIGLFLNYAIRDIINKNELNTRYNLNIKNYENLEKLDLSSKEISYIEILDKIRLDNLKELNLNDNQISDIAVFEKITFDKLEILNLSENQITDINVLAKAKYENMKILNLSENKIADIKVLEKVKFKLLKI